MNESFWDFPHSSKIDVLKEKRHSQTISEALADRQTQIKPERNSTWCIYGEEEALLVQPSSYYLRILLFWYYQILVIFS